MEEKESDEGEASRVRGNPEDSGNSKPREEERSEKGLAAEQEALRSGSSLVTATSKKPDINSKYLPALERLPNTQHFSGFSC